MERRQILKAALAGTVFLTAGIAIAQPGINPTTVSQSRFPQGVASADPKPDSIMLWTRVAPESSSTSVDLRLLVSEHPDFNTLVLDRVVTAHSANDFTVRAVVDGLSEDKHYYYRFGTVDNSWSREGRTRTAPAPDNDRAINLAFASCQNYEQGYFGAWARMITEDKACPTSHQIDFVLHLGDFIYERYHGINSEGERYARPLPSFPDGQQDGHRSYAWTLADYRHLYKVYLADPQLQAARARWPFVATWDDHEFSNDNYQSVATYHDQRVGHQRRKQDANRAWFEFMPAMLDDLSSTDSSQDAHDYRGSQPLQNGPLGVAEENGIHSDSDNKAAISSLCIYRQLRWGKHVDLLITDLRSYRSAPSVPPGLIEELGLPLIPVELMNICDAGGSYQDDNPPAMLPFGDGSSPNPSLKLPPGTMLGAKQKQWFKDKLAGSDATWKLWGNSQPCMSLRVDLGDVPLLGAQDSILIADTWAGYPGDLRELLQFVSDSSITNLVSLSGDLHLHGAAEVYDSDRADASTVALDFATAGISSTPHWESVLAVAKKSPSTLAELAGAIVDGKARTTWNMVFLDGVLATMAYAKTGLKSVARWLGPNRANPGLRHIDTHSNGYGTARLDGSGIVVNLMTIDDTSTPGNANGPAIKRAARFSAEPWHVTGEAVLHGPEISGQPPFPLDANELDSA